MQNIAEDLFKEENRDELTGNGAVIRFDTTILHSYFNYLESDMKVLEDIENKGYEIPKTGVFKVKCRLIEENVGGGMLSF